MRKPFYQGKLDVFCAMYAVLNGLRLTHGVQTLKARDLLNTTLFGLSRNPVVFRDVLEQKTDYVFVVDGMLNMIGKKFPLEVVKPFDVENRPDVEEFWQRCFDWLNPNGAQVEGRAIICRFLRYEPLKKSTIVKHWTTIDRIDGKKMHLFDSSHEAESIQNIGKDKIAVTVESADKERFLYMQPDTLRFLRLPF